MLIARNPNPDSIHFAANIFTGWDFYLNFAPRYFRRRAIAKKLLRYFEITSPDKLKKDRLSFSLPGETIVYAVSDLKGNSHPL